MSVESSTCPTQHNRNPKGKNQYKDCPPKNDAKVTELLYDYQRREIFDKKRISQLLYDEHGIKLSESSVARRRRSLGLYASGVTTRQLPETVKRQLVLTQMSKDPGKKLGPRMIKQFIAKETGIHLTRDYIRAEMLRHDPEGFAARDTSKRARGDPDELGAPETIQLPMNS
ncbi:hypothetical protein PAXINDRAFT_169591 [Paxillus involutus ATCC 200175]|uniref:Uncharacterized protein n=1 Tax=Paxillus involutus ATCC 200175 TaxID=664439 RepID=A0A0C9SXZ3_PAXIN|nr:hypothetical protein PAXINDRAFT_169591 [Paxillus involutus ATCC 200175]